jgi:hypothetical protein
VSLDRGDIDTLLSVFIIKKVNLVEFSIIRFLAGIVCTSSSRCVHTTFVAPEFVAQFTFTTGLFFVSVDVLFVVVV